MAKQTGYNRIDSLVHLFLFQQKVYIYYPNQRFFWGGLGLLIKLIFCWFFREHLQETPRFPVDRPTTAIGMLMHLEHMEELRQIRRLGRLGDMRRNISFVVGFHLGFSWDV